MFKGAVDAFIQAQRLTWSIAAIITLAGAILIVTTYRPLQERSPL
jgi:hypothetical protein